MEDKEEELLDQYLKLSYKTDREKWMENFAKFMEAKYPGSKVEVLEGGFRITAADPIPKLISNEFENMKNYN